MCHIIFRNIITILVLFYTMQGLYAQNNNPFEIRSRLDSVANLPVEIQEPNSSDSITLATNVLNPENDSLTSEENNPFEVDHLPLRKTKVENDKTTASESSNETLPEQNSNNFLFWILLLTAALLAIVININLDFIKLIFRSLANMNLFKLFYRDEGGKFSASLLFLYMIFLVNAATTTFLWFKEDHSTLNLQTWATVLLGISVFYVLKHSLISVIGYIFNIQKTTGLYNFSISTYHIFAGIVLLPLNFTIAFASTNISSIFLIPAIIVVAGIFLLKTGRGLFISLEFWNDRFFQFFMYLCAFEILPVLILVKFLMYQVNH